MKRKLIFALLILLVAFGGLAFRLPQLGLRPMHADEAVQAARFRELWLHHQYVYDPHEFHGPTLSYATLPSAWISGARDFADTTERMFRVVPVVFGVGLILVVWLLADGLGRPAVISAAGLIAISPAMVFYSRYYIHEMLLAFFTLAAFAAGWRYARTGKVAWCLAAGVSVGLMQATKETAVLAYAAAGLALAITGAWGRRSREHQTQRRPVPYCRHLGIGLATALFVAALLLSSLLTNLRGPVDGLLTYLPWLERAAGDSPHVHPAWFYLHRLAWWRLADGPLWSEGLILGLAVVGLAAALGLPRRMLADGSVGFVRWLGLYTLLLTAAYSVIPYKTPWCLVQFLTGMALLGGVGVTGLFRVVPTAPLKALAALGLLAAAGHLGWQSYRASFLMPADPENPYVYAQTLPDVLRLRDDVEQLALASPQRRQMPVKVIWDSAYYWPLPWYFREYEHVELWTTLPDQPAAPVVISSPKHDEALTERLEDTHLMTGYYGIRPSVLAQLWVRLDVWEAHLRRLGRIQPDPHPPELRLWQCKTAW